MDILGSGEFSTSHVPSEGQHLQLGPQAAGTVPKAEVTAETFSHPGSCQHPSLPYSKASPLLQGQVGVRCFRAAGPAEKHPESSPLLRAGARGAQLAAQEHLKRVFHAAQIPGGGICSVSWVGACAWELHRALGWFGLG